MPRIFASSILWFVLIPLVSTLIAGVINPYVEGVFLANALFVCAFLFVATPLVGTRIEDADDVSILRPATHALPYFSLSFALVALGIMAGSDQLARAEVGKLFSLTTLYHLLGVVVIPLVSYGLLNVKKLDKPHYMAGFAGAVVIASGGTLFINARFSFHGLVTLFSDVTDILLLHLVILVLTGLMTLFFFAALMAAPRKIINKINQQPVVFFVLPGAVGLMDLVTIIQGFRGLREHYSEFENVALGGMLIAFLSMILMLGFGASAIHKGFRKKGMSHYLLSAGLSIALGCLVMYATAEIAGYWYKYVASSS